jgi:hypothetical protein
MCKVYNKYHNNAPKGAVYIGRPSKWGNPFTIGVDGTREEVINKYEKWLCSNPALISEATRELVGKDLVCFCSPKSCHGDILIRVANGTSK